MATKADLLALFKTTEHPLALVMSALLVNTTELVENVIRAAELGHGRAIVQRAYLFATTHMCLREEAQLEPLGLYCLFKWERRLDCCKRAAELGWKDAMHNYAEAACKRGEREWFYWMARAAAGGREKSATEFIHMAQRRQEEFLSGLARRAEVCYYVGSLLEGHLDEKDWVVFGIKCDFHVMKPLLRLLETFRRNRKGARDAVNTWLLTARALNKDSVVLNRDMRAMIGRLVWERRFEWHIKFH